MFFSFVRTYRTSLLAHPHTCGALLVRGSAVIPLAGPRHTRGRTSTRHDARGKTHKFLTPPPWIGMWHVHVQHVACAYMGLVLSGPARVISTLASQRLQSWARLQSWVGGMHMSCQRVRCDAA